MRLSPALVLCLGTAAAIAVVAASPHEASAYPQFQFSTDNSRCNLCHFSPVGGGLINDYGRDEAGGTISRGGDGRFLHGAWTAPEWFQIGADYRGAALIRQSEGQTEFLGFPMQADLYLRGQVGAITANVTVGMRGVARDPKPPLADRFVSREHYLMWQKSKTDLYVRAGRFWTPYGLRVQDHTSYIRRFLGMHMLEEPYAVSTGKVDDDQEWHATLTTPLRIGRLSSGRAGWGGAVLYEKRVREETASWGAQTKINVADDTTSILGGGLGKVWLEDQRVLLLGELDLGVETFRVGDGDPRGQLAAYLGASWFYKTGIIIGGTLERWDPDVLLEGTARDAATLSIQYLPRAHWELILLGKVEIQSGDLADPSAFTMLQLHYYL